MKERKQRQKKSKLIKANNEINKNIEATGKETLKQITRNRKVRRKKK